MMSSEVCKKLEEIQAIADTADGEEPLMRTIRRLAREIQVELGDVGEEPPKPAPVVVAHKVARRPRKWKAKPNGKVTRSRKAVRR